LGLSILSLFVKKLVGWKAAVERAPRLLLLVLLVLLLEAAATVISRIKQQQREERKAPGTLNLQHLLMLVDVTNLTIYLSDDGGKERHAV
jgi:UDP-N-acetylmuramyl pentapeptide phosphotransferase/UDP-N-acetylglucosamine-1-phosphate transferase